MNIKLTGPAPAYKAGLSGRTATTSSKQVPALAAVSTFFFAVMCFGATLCIVTKKSMSWRIHPITFNWPLTDVGPRRAKFAALIRCLLFIIVYIDIYYQLSGSSPKPCSTGLPKRAKQHSTADEI